jgi:hypothetical protein
MATHSQSITVLGIAPAEPEISDRDLNNDFFLSYGRAISDHSKQLKYAYELWKKKILLTNTRKKE